MLQLILHWRAATKGALQRLGQAVKIVAFLSVSLLVAYSRVYLGYHTVPQVVAGAVAGSFMAGLWFTAIAGMAHHFVSLQKSSVGKLFRLKDTWQIPDVLLFEHMNVNQRHQNRKDQ